jgi:hypothetical protein
MTTGRLREWCGCALLFVFYDFLWVGFAAALLLSGKDSQGFIAIGAVCVVGASAAYAARVGLEDGRWERLYMPVLPAFLAAVFAVYGIAGAESITIAEASLGFGWTLLVASLFAVPTTVFHLRIRRNEIKTW